MLYMDSLKAPPPRANDTDSLKRAQTRSGLSWRDGGEVSKLSENMLGPAPSSLAPTATFEAFGETFGADDKHIVDRMLAGSSAARGTLSHAPPLGSSELAHGPGSTTTLAGVESITQRR